MIDFSGVKAITIPEGSVKKITCNGVVKWKSGYTNLVPLSTTEDDKTIYNGGLGYKNGYRVRSGGAEQEYNSACTGFIPVKGGDIVRLSGWNFSHPQNGNAINVYNSSHTTIGQFTMLPASYGILASSPYNAYHHDSVVQEKTGVWKWIVPPTASGVSYIRVTGYYSSNDLVGVLGSKMIITVNEEIE